MSCSGLNKGDDVMVPLDGGHGDPLGQVLGTVDGGGDRGDSVNDLTFAGTYCGDQVFLLCW